MKTKKTYIEIIRVLAILMVLFQHSGNYGSTLYYKADNAAEYAVSLFLSLFCKIAVSLFFMISGALLLGKEEPLRVVFKKRILRMLVVLLTVSLFYYLYGNRADIASCSVAGFALSVWKSPETVPLWYLYSYVSALLMLPFLRKLAKTMETKDYMYLFLLNFVFDTVAVVLGYFAGAKLTPYMSVPIAVERNTFYMLAGYFCEHKAPEKLYSGKTAAALCAGGTAYILVACALTHIVCRREGYSDGASLYFYNHFISLTAVSVYVLIKYAAGKRGVSDKASAFWCFLGENVFGVYLLEQLLRERLRFIVPALKSVTGDLPACFVWLFACFALGVVITFILRRIPLVRKYI